MESSCSQPNPWPAIEPYLPRLCMGMPYKVMVRIKVKAFFFVSWYERRRREREREGRRERRRKEGREEGRKEKEESEYVIYLIDTAR